MKNNQAIYSILVMLTFWCLWNTVKINNVKSDVENVDRIINRLSSEYQKEEEEKATSHRMSDEYEKTYFPQVFAQYRSMYGDATLTILSNKNNPLVEVRFQDVFPTSLGGLSYTQTATDVEYLTVDATFQYKIYEIVTL